MKIIIILLIIATSFSLQAQQNFDIGAPSETGGNYGTINFVDISALGNKKTEVISYSDISGSPFWDDNWNTALLFLNNNTVVKVQKAKLNLYNNEVHFIDKNNTELAGEINAIKKVIFFKGTDTTKMLGVFESLADSSNPAKISFYQVYNEGSIKLLSLKKKFIKEKEYNPMIGATEHTFVIKENYAVENNDNITAVKLNQSGILAVVKPSADAYQWLKQNNNKLKSVNEIVSFFNYCNAALKK